MTGYRTLFAGTLVQESFLSVGGTDDPFTTVDSPFCRDGLGRPTLRGSGLAGALVATLRRLKGGRVPTTISGAEHGRTPSVWRTFDSHPPAGVLPVFRQHVAIDERTGAAAEQALYGVETLPPGTRWPFLLEVDTRRDPDAADCAREALAQWAAGRCLIGREVARGLGWMRLEGLTEYRLGQAHIDQWPNAAWSAHYPCYVAETFAALAEPVSAAEQAPPHTLEIAGRLIAGPRDDGYGLDSLSVGGHASEELAAAWDGHFLAADGQAAEAARAAFDPDFAIVTYEGDDRRIPYVPGSSLRGPLRHALRRLLRARGEDPGLADCLFGTTDRASGKLLIRDALPGPEDPVELAWLQMHAEDEFSAGAYAAAKFDRIAVTRGVFHWRMLLEADGAQELRTLYEQGLAPLLELARAGAIALGGGQWRGHGWLRWEIDTATLPWETT